MEHKVWYNTENDICYLELNGMYHTSDAIKIKELLTETLEGKPFKQVLIKMSNDNKIENREARQKAIEAMQAGIKEAAFVGGLSNNRILAKVLLKASGIKVTGDFFKNDEDAIKWLISKR